MKIAFYSESPSDQAALVVFAEGILGEVPESSGLDLAGSGVTTVLRTLDSVFRGVYYNSDAEGLVVAVDSDDTEPHDVSHDNSPTGAEGCRFCEVRRIVNRARNMVKPKPNRPPLRVAIGLAVPAIEAWYLVGKGDQLGEAPWKVARAAGRSSYPIKQQMKLQLYGTDRPPLEHQTACAVREARRVIDNLTAIQTAFPDGFGLMAREIRSWKTRPADASSS